MKCPTCNEELVRSKKNPEYMLCYNCKKKYKVKHDHYDSKQSYSNIPEEKVRKKSEKKVREGYRELEAANDVKGRREGGSMVPLVILGVLIVIVAGLIVYMLLK